MKTVLEILNLSLNFLKEKGIAHPRRQAEELLGEALGLGRMGLYLEYDRPLTEIELEKCRAWLKRRGKGEPLQYISGEVEFLTCRLKVNSDVLIPRQETEILVEKIIKTLSKESLEGKVFFDICCGSGCIGIAIKKHFPTLHVIVSDLSEKALNLCRINAEKNDVELNYLQGDLLSCFGIKKADYIVCNPPYISEKEYDELDIEVREYEPKMALVSGKSGLEMYLKLSNELQKHLNSKGKVWFEIGTNQALPIRNMFSASYWSLCEHELDWSGKERFFSLEIE